MYLERRATGRALVVLTASLLVVLTAAGCASTRLTNGQETADARPVHHAFALTAAQAVRITERAVRHTPGLRGRLTTCPGSDACHAERHARWETSVQRTGRPLVHGNGFAAHLYLGVVAFRTPAAARRFVSTVHDRFGAYERTFHLPMTPGKGNMYTPGEDGVGTMSDLVSGRWHGWKLELRRDFTFFDYSHSADLFTHRYLVARGRFACGATVDARSVHELRRMSRAWPAFLRSLTAAGEAR